MLRKITGLIFVLFILFIALFLLNECKSKGGGNIPLALKDTPLKK